ncbi:ArsR/SmtB family transcription factor [Mycoplasmopsis gallopavonis]|uniref:Predicted ArsR-family transcription repressor n=1 Tax=Mycoplasmopsis gallopavonis TaxID=76629 RepID=A0A449B056_9BACT|nr:helix-turn-helix transcriptional regulator [Mycoplasmopsis gallopavonis]RIV16839.1 transcriptional regulator [Mycoplasmopsis gallopavonis]VEU73143.1 predicted ArsR-family transcription repressor [Mycoplasmopsis gallopavonis]
MKTTKLLTLLSKEVKLKLIIHLFSCVENECEVNTFVDILREKQANISKHLNDLKREGVVESRKVGVFVYYYMLPSFKNKYGALLEEIIKLEEMQKFECKCSST